MKDKVLITELISKKKTWKQKIYFTKGFYSFNENFLETNFTFRKVFSDNKSVEKIRYLYEKKCSVKKVIDNVNHFEKINAI